jgi:hypothetical protein
VVEERSLSLAALPFPDVGTNLDLGTQYDVARDGRFLVNTDLEEATVPITLIQN